MPFFDNDGVRLHYIVSGPEDGPATVFVNGYCSNYEINWVGSRWIEMFTTAGRRTIGLEPRGHGRSDKPHSPEAYGPQMVDDVVRLLDHLELEVADYVGYSMGAQIGLRMVIGNRDRIRRAVLCGIGAAVLETWGHGGAIARRMRGDDSETSPAARMFYEFAIRVPGNDLEALACCITGRTEPVTRQDLASIQTSILIAAGGADPIARDPQRLAELIPGAELFIVPGRDHTTAVPARAIKERALEFLERR